MMYRYKILLIISICFWGCTEHSKKTDKKLGEKYNGIFIMNSVRFGRLYTDKVGIKYGYTYITTTLTNDTLVPISIQLATLNDYYKNGHKYKLIILPENYSTENQEFKNFSPAEISKLIGNIKDSPTKVDKVIKPNEQYHLNIGVLFPYNEIDDNMGPAFLVIMGDQKPHFYPIPDDFISFPDSLINTKANAINKMNISMALLFSKNKKDSVNTFSAIHLGQLTFY